MSVTLFLCDVVQGGQRSRAPQQPGASWEFFIHDDLIHRLELPLSTKVQSTMDKPDSYWLGSRKKKKRPTIRNHSLHCESFKREKPKKWGSQICPLLSPVQDIREETCWVSSGRWTLCFLPRRQIYSSRARSEREDPSVSQRGDVHLFDEKSKAWGKKQRVNWWIYHSNRLYYDLSLQLIGINHLKEFTGYFKLWKRSIFKGALMTSFEFKLNKLPIVWVQYKCLIVNASCSVYIYIYAVVKQWKMSPFIAFFFFLLSQCARFQTIGTSKMTADIFSSLAWKKNSQVILLYSLVWAS